MLCACVDVAEYIVVSVQDVEVIDAVCYVAMYYADDNGSVVVVIFDGYVDDMVVDVVVGDCVGWCGVCGCVVMCGCGIVNYDVVGMYDMCTSVYVTGVGVAVVVIVYMCVFGCYVVGIRIDVVWVGLLFVVMNVVLRVFASPCVLLCLCTRWCCYCCQCSLVSVACVLLLLMYALLHLHVCMLCVALLLMLLVLVVIMMMPSLLFDALIVLPMSLALILRLVVSLLHIVNLGMLVMMSHVVVIVSLGVWVCVCVCVYWWGRVCVRVRV